MKSLADRRIAILGRGIAGLTLTHRLLGRGARPTIFGRIEGSASRCAQGVVANKGLIFHQSPLFAAKLQSLGHIQGWLSEIEGESGVKIGRSFDGIDEPYHSEDDFQELLTRIYRQRFLGCHRTKNKKAEDAWPFSSKLPLGRLHYPADGWFDVSAALQGLEAIIAKAQVRTHTNLVEGIELSPDGSLRISDREKKAYSFDQVIIASGAGSSALLHSLEQIQAKTFLIGGQTLTVPVAEEALKPSTLVRKTLSATWHGKEVLIGASSWKGQDIDAEALEADRQALYEQACHYFSFDQSRLKKEHISSRQGTRLRFADRMPAVGSLPFPQWRNRLFLCTGFYKNGLQLADLCAQDLVACLEEKAPLYPDFNPRRLFKNYSEQHP